MALINQSQVSAALDALWSGQRERMIEYWSPEVRWLVPGHNQFSGWKNNLDEFVDVIGQWARLSENSFQADTTAVMTAEDASANVTHAHGHRAGEPQRVLDIDMTFFLRWRDGKIIEGQAAIFGDGTAQYDAFWA